ncbi:hypothetical protein [Asanoa sp. NPDC050611]|uniref:hypothetical protein n=1 Tax=Asanoa sp. NPDC050611 TaxID=3157098 RepID=UPI00340F864A
MTDDWTWGDGHDSHDDHSGYEGAGDHQHHHEGGFDADDTDPFGPDLGGVDLPGGGPHDDLGGHDDAPDFNGEPDSDVPAEDPFAPDALVADHHDWAAGLDDDGTDGLGPVDATDLFGTDPDVSAYTDALWPAPEFPAPLDLGPVLPEPIDGSPWTDPAALGSPDPAAVMMPVEVPEPTDLAAYAGLDPASSGWEALLGSEDPATAALARFWSPPQP